jgi:phosphoserine phosphatase
VKNIKVGPLRIVCPRERREGFERILFKGTKEPDRDTVQWAFSENHGDKQPHWSRGLSFGNILPPNEASLVETIDLVRHLMDQGDTVGIMGAGEASKVKALFFDMDATVIIEESLVEIAARRGLSEKIHKITEEAMAGKLDFVGALKKRVAMLEGTPLDVVTDLQHQLTLQPGIRELVDGCKRRGIDAFMVSGGFTVLAQPIALRAGMTGFRANTFEIRLEKLPGQKTPQKVLGGGVEGPIVDAQGKKDFLLATCQEYGISSSQSIAVGDGANDLLMIETAAYGVGLKPKHALRPALHLQNQVGDHRVLSYFLFGELFD